MSKLKNLYLALENLQSAGFPIDDKLMTQISELEEKIIKNDILPVLQTPSSLLSRRLSESWC